MRHSSFSFKLHKNERTEKEWGFYAHILHATVIESFSNPEPILHLCQMGGLSIASESWLFLLSPYTPSTGYSSGHPWRLVSVSSSQCCQVILSDVSISLKIVCLESISHLVLCTISHVSILLWSLNHIPLFRVNWWRIHQCLLLQRKNPPSVG